MLIRTKQPAGLIKKQPGQNMRSVPSDQLVRWLGQEKVDHISAAMLGNTQRWYGPPIRLLDVPGEVYATGDGDFIGTINGGYFAGAVDMIEQAVKRFIRASGRVQHGYCNVGFASISDALLRASSGYSQTPGGMFNKVGPTGVIGVTSSLHKIGPQPAAGVAAAAAGCGTSAAAAAALPGCGVLALSLLFGWAD
jgi:hypothetical protein